MLIDFATKIKNFDGTLILDEKNQTTSLGTVAITALVTLTKKDESVDAKTKYEWGVLADKIYGGKKLDLKSNEIVLLKERIGQLFGPLVIRQAWDLLEGGEITEVELKKKRIAAI